MDNDKRNLKRRHLIYYLSVYDRMNNRLLGYIVDLSSEGFKLMSDAAIETNTVFKLKMMLAEKVKGFDHINFKAKSIWSRKDAHSEFYDTGFKLLDTSKNELESIQNLIQELGFKD